MQETAVFHKTREGGAWPASAGKKKEMSPLRTVRDTFFKKILPFPFFSFPPAAEIPFRTQGTCCTTLQRRKRAYSKRETLFPATLHNPTFPVRKRGKKIRNLHRRRPVSPTFLLFSPSSPQCAERRPRLLVRGGGKGRREGFQASQSAAGL